MAYNDLPPLGQATKAASLPVTIASDQEALPLSTDAATETKQDTVIAQLDSVIAPDGGAQPADGVVIMGHTGSGTVAHLRVDTNGVVSVNVNNIAAGDNNIGNVDVVSLPALPAGTNNIGDVDILSIAAGDNNIGNVDVVTLPSIPAGTNNIGDVDVLTMPGIVVEDAAETVGGNLMAVGTVRRDTAASSAGTTGDNATLNTDSVGALWTRDTATQVDDAAFTPGTGRIMPVAFFADETATDSVNEGDAGVARMTLNRRLITAGNVLDDSPFNIGTEYTNPVSFLADETATDSVEEGDAGIARMTLDRKQIVTTYAHAAGGATPYKLISAASTNATSVKASAGTVYMITASNVNAAVRYLKLYNKASAPTVGTDTPVFTFAIPGNTAGAGTNIPVPTVGLNFSTGIAFALTTEITDAGSTGVAASEIAVNLAYT